jgi:predicted O-methyltransferase YrrM
MHARRVRWPRVARQLRDRGPVGKGVARALIATLRSELEPNEKEWVARIEALRAQLESSWREVAIPAYGDFRRLTAANGGARGEPPPVGTTVGTVTRSSNGPWSCALLMRLVRELVPRRCVELGTCVGISAAYQGAALDLNGTGRLVTIEGAAELGELSRENVDGLGLSRVHVRTARFGDALPALARELGPVDFALIDGDHTEEGTVANFEALLDSIADDAVLVFDDIRWSAGMRRAWSRIARHEHTATAIDLGTMGIWSPAR